MDILKIISGTDLYNLHSHTEFCDGRAQMEAFARKAIELGFKVYGFTPHSPIPVTSGCNMLAGNVERYIKEADRIKHEYADKTLFLTSMEIDYLGEDWGPGIDYFREMPLDYRIGSVHFVPTQENELIDVDGSSERFVKNLHNKFNNDVRYVVEKFYEQSIRMVQAGGFDIIGHFDKIGENSSYYSPGIEDEPWYQSLVSDLINNIKSNGIIAEINTKVYADRNRFFPGRRYWKQLSDAEIPVVVNSDAHVPALINASRFAAIELMRNPSC